MGRYHLTRALLSLLTFAGVMLLFPAGAATPLLRMHVGQVAPRKVVAPVSFRVFKAPGQLDTRAAARPRTPCPRWSRWTRGPAASLARLGEFVPRVRILARGRGLSPQQRLNTYRKFIANRKKIRIPLIFDNSRQGRRGTEGYF